MIVSYPNNPTGAVADDRFYTELIAFAKRWDIAVLHDNAYSELVFDGKRGKSFLSYPGAKDVGVELNSFSKTYGMAGARLGVCVGNRELIAGYHRLASLRWKRIRTVWRRRERLTSIAAICSCAASGKPDG